MLGRILRVRGIIPVILILAAFGYWRLHPGPPKFIAIGYVADRDVPLWNTLAQVRERVGDLHYGERVEIVRQEGTATQIRTRLAGPQRQTYFSIHAWHAGPRVGPGYRGCDASK